MDELSNTNDFILMALFTFVYVSFFLPMGSVIPIVILLVYYIIKYRGQVILRPSFFLLYIIAFVGFCFMSSLWARSPDNVLVQANHLLKTSFGIIVLYFIGCKEDCRRYFMNSILFGGYILILCVIALYGFDGIKQMLIYSERISNDVMNANQLAMCISYSVVIHFYYGVTKKWTPFHLIMIPAILFVAITQSRKGLIVLVVGIIGAVIINNHSKKTIDGAIKSLLLIGLLFLVGYFLLQLPIFDGLNERMSSFFGFVSGKTSGDTSLAARSGLIDIGLNIFKEHPICGVGIDNARLYTASFYGSEAYLHNNYMEILADGGVVGFGLYYSMYVYLLANLKKRVRDNKDVAFNLLFIIILLLVQLAHVSYKSSGEYYYLLMIYLFLYPPYSHEADI